MKRRKRDRSPRDQGQHRPRTAGSLPRPSLAPSSPSSPLRQAGATANDSFVAGPSGAGYTYPQTFDAGLLQASPPPPPPRNRPAALAPAPAAALVGPAPRTKAALDRAAAFAEATGSMMAASGMTLLNVIGDAPSRESVEPLAAQVE